MVFGFLGLDGLLRGAAAEGLAEVGPFMNRYFLIPQEAQVHHAIGLPFLAVLKPLGSIHLVFFFSFTQYVSIFSGNIFL